MMVDYNDKVSYYIEVEIKYRNVTYSVILTWLKKKGWL